MDPTDRNTLLDKAARARAVDKLQKGYRAAFDAFKDTFFKQTGQSTDRLPHGFRPSEGLLTDYNYCTRENASPQAKAILELYDRATKEEFDKILQQVDALTGVLQLGLES